MGTSESDAVIIGASRSDPGRFGEIFDRHIDAVHGYLTRRLGRSRADDLSGEVFRIAFEARERYLDQRSSARPWLLGIATNLVMKDRRREQRQLRALARLRGRRDLISDPTAVDDRLDSDRAAATLLGALGDLDPRDRSVLLLIAWEDLSYQEVADALDVPIGTVRSRLHRARRILRTHIHPDGVDAPDPPEALDAPGPSLSIAELSPEVPPT
jgi:RNA polymerase sigma-70 factor (ECF subfamily)